MMKGRRCKGLPLLVAICVGSLGVVAFPGGAGATSSASGNAQAISLYTKAVAATNDQPVLQDTSTDTYFLEDNITTLTSPSSFSYVLKAALPTVPAGFVRARTVTTFRLVQGVVTWATTLVTPLCARTIACKKIVGLEFYDTASQEKMALLTGSPRSYCWAQTQAISLASFAFAPHSGVWTTSGYFSPIRKVAGQTLFVSRYSDNGLTITEDDYQSAATHLFDRSVHHYAASGSIRAVTTETSEVDPTVTPSPPHFPACTS
jgi:hypothetical protein